MPLHKQFKISSDSGKKKIPHTVLIVWQVLHERIGLFLSSRVAAGHLIQASAHCATEQDDLCPLCTVETSVIMRTPPPLPPHSQAVTVYSRHFYLHCTHVDHCTSHTYCAFSSSSFSSCSYVMHDVFYLLAQSCRALELMRYSSFTLRRSR